MNDSIAIVLQKELYNVEFPFNNSIHYRVMKNRFILGWIFVQQVNLENGHNIWGGTTTELREIAQNLGYVVDLHREDQN